jgi:endo-1,4-beta-xylanase
MINRRAFLKSTIGTVGWLSTPPLRGWAGTPDPQTDTDEHLLLTARERIARHRRGNGLIEVRDAGGNPVPGAKVKVEQTHHDFLFGCNFFRFDRIADPDREAEYRRQFAALLNYATIAFYWPYYEPRRGHPRYGYTDQVVAWCAPHGITCKGHPLVWDFADPAWLPHDFTDIGRLSHQRVHDIVSRYRNRIHFWDVVNEPTALGRFHTRIGEWALSLGPGPYTAQHLRIARAANPKATLLVNDYRTDPAYYRILNGLRDQDRLLFDVIGLQSHMHAGTWPLARVWKVCDDFSRLGTPLHFTETTVLSGGRAGRNRWGPTTSRGEAAQADYVPRFYTMLFGHPAVEAITWWDFSDDGAWQGAPAGLVRKDMSPKPAYERLHALIKNEWWTKLEGHTGSRGEFALTAFYGTHRVTATLPTGRRITRDVHWESGNPNRFTLTPGG